MNLVTFWHTASPSLTATYSPCIGYESSLKNHSILSFYLLFKKCKVSPAPNSKFLHLAQLPRLSSHPPHCDFLSSQPPWLTHAAHSTWSIFLSHHTYPHFQYAPFPSLYPPKSHFPTWSVFLLFLPKMIALLRTSITVESVCFTALQFENSWSIFSKPIWGTFLVIVIRIHLLMQKIQVRSWSGN